MSAAGVLLQPAVGMQSETVPEGSYLFGFDPSNPENEHWVFAADGESTREANQHFAEPFLLSTWAVKRITLPGEGDNAETTHARLTLIDPTDEVLSFVSVGALGSLDLIRTLRGDGPYDPPLPLIVTESKTRHGYRVYKLRIVQERQSPKSAK